MTKRDDTKMLNLLNICILIDFMTLTLSKFFALVVFTITPVIGTIEQSSFRHACELTIHPSLDVSLYLFKLPICATLHHIMDEISCDGVVECCVFLKFLA